MKTLKIAFEVLVPFLVTTGVCLFILLPTNFFNYFDMNNLFELADFVPKNLLLFIGAMNVLFYLPMFFAGFFALTRKGALGQAKKVCRKSAYKYLRHPMYAGVSFTIFGIGLIIVSTGVAFAGMLWLLWCYLFCRIEEKKLIEKFGYEYQEFKSETPMFVPRFDIIIADILSIQTLKKQKKWKEKTNKKY